MVALAIIGTVFAALAALQVTSLSGAREARRVQQATAELRAFVETLRANPQALSALCANPSGFDASFQVSCRATPCQLQSDGSLTCTSTVGEPVAYRVQLELADAGSQRQLSRVDTVVAR